MDGRDVEPSSGLHKSQSWLHSLLRRNLCGAVSGGVAWLTPSSSVLICA